MVDGTSANADNTLIFSIFVKIAFSRCLLCKKNSPWRKTFYKFSLNFL